MDWTSFSNEGAKKYPKSFRARGLKNSRCTKNKIKLEKY